MANNFIYLEDSVSKCHSIMMHVSLSAYLGLINEAYEDDGKLYGQRSALTSASAKKVREQMRHDFTNGSVLPPVVIGLIDSSFNENVIKSEETLIEYIKSMRPALCIIDGMQRTTAMREALQENEDLANRTIRVEFWITDTTSNLIYRMLVLNTGQVPWNTKRQLEVVLKPIINDIENSIDLITLIESNDGKRRTRAGEFQADKILESFLVYGARSEKANKKDIIAEEYTKLEFIESSSKNQLLETYISILKRIVELDVIFSSCTPNENEFSSFKFKKGLDLFTSQPLFIGMTVAFAIKTLGRPKQDYSKERQEQNLAKLLAGLDKFIVNLRDLTPEQLEKFIAFDSLAEQLPSSTSSRIGDVEREFFKSAFNVLIEEDFDISSMDLCWSN
ncbi:TPA: hypothetical protein I7160_02220 [Vibrio vulnificus]|nr:hypothetical protein [Vibrio vulnificus]